ncbi:MAG: HugZ family protein [Beijerinckiaceae bacterium]
MSDEAKGDAPGTAGERQFPLPEGYDAVGEAKRLLRSIRAGALATLSQDGFPFASLVNVATDFDGSPLLLMSGLSAHTRHLEAEPRASLLLSEGGKGDPLAHPRLTVTGRAQRMTDESQRASVKARFLSRHPKSALYADFGDFAFWRLEVARAHLNGGFARAATFQAAQILTDVSDSAELIEIESSAIEHMNADHSEALRLYAVNLCGEPDGRWRATGVDPDGMDLASGDLVARLAFPARVTGGDMLRRTLADLGAAARAK